MYGAKLITQLPDGVVDSSMLVVIGDGVAVSCWI